MQIPLCNVPICAACDSLDEHEQHIKQDIVKAIAKKKERMKSDLQELEKSIYSKYHEAATKITSFRVIM